MQLLKNLISHSLIEMGQTWVLLEASTICRLKWGVTNYPKVPINWLHTNKLHIMVKCMVHPICQVCLHSKFIWTITDSQSCQVMVLVQLLIYMDNQVNQIYHKIYPHLISIWWAHKVCMVFHTTQVNFNQPNSNPYMVVKII
jgi:hypothetical protein